MDAILEFLSALPREIYVFIISMLPIVELRGAIPIGCGLGMPFYTNYPIAVIGNLLPVPFIIFFISKFLDFLARFRIFRPMINWIRRKADKHSSKIIKDSGEVAGENISPDNCGTVEAEPIAAEACTDKIEADCAEGVEATACTDKIEADCAEGLEATACTDKIEAECCKSDSEAMITEGLQDEAKSTALTPSDGAAENAELAEAEIKKTVRKRRMTRAIFGALILFVAIPLPGTGAWTGGLVAALFDLPKKKSILAIAIGVLLSGVIMTLASYAGLEFLQIFMNK